MQLAALATPAAPITPTVAAPASPERVAAARALMSPTQTVMRTIMANIFEIREPASLADFFKGVDTAAFNTAASQAIDGAILVAPETKPLAADAHKAVDAMTKLISDGQKSTKPIVEGDGSAEIVEALGNHSEVLLQMSWKIDPSATLEP